MFLRKTIATLIGLGALFSANVGEAGAISTVEVRCTAPECYEPGPPLDPPDEPPSDGPDPGSGGDADGGGGEPECPDPPGGSNILPSAKSLSCPPLTCDALLPVKPCPSRVGRPSSWDEGRDSVRAGSAMARLIALADPNSQSGNRLLPGVRGSIQAAISAFNQAGPFASLDDTRRSLSNSLSEACNQQRQEGAFMNAGWPICADVAVDIGREAIDDPGFLRYFLDQLALNGFGVDEARYGPISWLPGSNSLAAHHFNIDRQHACAWWWEQVDRLKCGVP